MKKQDKTSEKLNEMEISNLPEKEFIIMIVKNQLRTQNKAKILKKKMLGNGEKKKVLLIDYFN